MVPQVGLEPTLFAYETNQTTWPSPGGITKNSTTNLLLNGLSPLAALNFYGYLMVAFRTGPVLKLGALLPVHLHGAVFWTLRFHLKALTLAVLLRHPFSFACPVWQVLRVAVLPVVPVLVPQPE